MCPRFRSSWAGSGSCCAGCATTDDDSAAPESCAGSSGGGLCLGAAIMCTQKMLFVLPGAFAGPRALGAGRRPASAGRAGSSRCCWCCVGRRRSVRAHLGRLRRSGRRPAIHLQQLPPQRALEAALGPASADDARDQLADSGPRLSLGASVGDVPLLSSAAARVRRRPAALHPGRAHRRDRASCPRRTSSTT